ncbi:MAG: AarF/UbiB family protein, partial [Pseudomonadota bacterium]
MSQSTLDDVENDSGQKIPANRASRLTHVASLATGLVGGMMAEGVRQVAKGNKPKVSDLLLTPKNAKRVANQLMQLRGAAMKVGQLISMDSGELLPPEFSEILSTLRENAKPMPFGDLAEVLKTEWGSEWDDQFSEFSFSPVSAASIGQVHRARTKDGTLAAVKIQYPNIDKSIESDVDNIATLFRISGLLPDQFQLDYLLNDIKL